MNNSLESSSIQQPNAELMSEFINLIRFPLIVLVVLIHSHFIPVGYSLPYNSYMSEYPIYCNISYLCSELIARVAVPLFFVISGYLFFKKNVRAYSLKDYRSKIRTRLHSLFIPYVFWNVLIFALTLLVQIARGGVSDENSILNYSISDYFRVFWDIRNGMPFCFQLWFIRDLIVLTLISPIIYHLLKYKGVASFVLLVSTVWWFVDIDNVRWYLNSQSVMFFCLGAYFAIHQFDIADKLLRVKKISYIASLLLVALVMVSFNSGYFYALSQTLRQCFYHLCVFSLILSFAVFCLDSIKKRSWRTNTFLLNSTFFIYGYHAIVLGYIYAFINQAIHVKSDLLLLLFYFLAPIAVIGLGLLIFAVLKSLSPKFTSLITGGRL